MPIDMYPREKNNDIHPAAHTHNNTLITRSHFFSSPFLYRSRTHPTRVRANTGCLSDEN